MSLPGMPDAGGHLHFHSTVQMSLHAGYIATEVKTIFNPASRDRLQFAVFYFYSHTIISQSDHIFVHPNTTLFS